MSAFVERLSTAAAGVVVVIVVFQLTVTAHVLVAVIDLAITTSMCRLLVNRGPAASRIRAVRLLANTVVWTAYVGGGVVPQCATAADVVSHQGVDSTCATRAASRVVNSAVTAAGVSTVRQWTNAAAVDRTARCTDHNATRDKGIYPKLSLR